MWPAVRDEEWGSKATSKQQTIKGAAQIASFEPRSGVIQSVVAAGEERGASDLLRTYCVRSTVLSSVMRPVTRFAGNPRLACGTR